jgi:hypothetical protein
MPRRFAKKWPGSWMSWAVWKRRIPRDIQIGLLLWEE